MWKAKQHVIKISFAFCCFQKTVPQILIFWKWRQGRLHSSCCCCANPWYRQTPSVTHFYLLWTTFQKNEQFIKHKSTVAQSIYMNKEQMETIHRQCSQQANYSALPWVGLRQYPSKNARVGLTNCKTHRPKIRHHRQELMVFQLHGRSCFSASPTHAALCGQQKQTHWLSINGICL